MTKKEKTLKNPLSACTGKPTRYVIVGASVAAVGCVEGIRSRDREGEITMISREPCRDLYSRPLISYLLAGKTDRERMKYRPDSFLTENNVVFLPACEATAVRREEKKLLLGDGTALPYDKLFLATGSTPFVPPMAGLESVGRYHHFMTLADAEGLAADLTPDAEVLIVGAGLIGIKCAEAVLGRVAGVTVVDMAPRVLPAVLDEDGAVLVRSHLEKNGIAFRLGDSIGQFDGHTATLAKSGEKIPFTVLVLAVGVRPAVTLFESAGCSLDRGVIVSDKSETTVPDIYAAGDCVKSHDISADTDRILALLPNAYQGGECAGINMAGGEKRLTSLFPLNATTLFGLPLTTAGSYDGESDCFRGDGVYRRFIRRGNRLVGFLLIGDVKRAGIYSALIREGTPLDRVDYGSLLREPSLIAFQPEERAWRLNRKPYEKKEAGHETN